MNRRSPTFSAKTFCTLYRIEKEYLKPCLDARHDISEAMKALFDYRMHTAQTLIQETPKVVEKKGVFCSGCASVAADVLMPNRH